MGLKLNNRPNKNKDLGKEKRFGMSSKEKDKEITKEKKGKVF